LVNNIRKPNKNSFVSIKIEFKPMKHFFLIILCLFLCKNTFAQKDALEFGQCFKIGILKNGVYRIDANILTKNGIDISKINPKNIHIYGNGAGMLPQPNAVKRPEALIENAIHVQGEADGQFNKTDYIQFYAQGPHSINFDFEKKLISHKTHLYSDSSFYFLVINDKLGLRIDNRNDENMKQGSLIDSYDDYFYHENDLKNINNKNNESGKSGREFVGEELSQNTDLNRSFELKINNIIPNSKINLATTVVGTTKNENSNFKIYLNDAQVQEIETEPVYDYEYGAKGALKSLETKLNANNSTLQKIDFKLTKSIDNYTIGFLDKFGLNIKRALNYEGNPFAFRSFSSLQNNYSTFTIKTIEPKLIVWDITNPLSPKNQQFRNESNKIFTINTQNILKEYYVFNEANILPISTFSKINNQNIRNYKAADLLIVTTKKFKKAAQKLADHRIKNDKISVEVVQVDEIYNEFSSGMVDVTAIRDFVKYLYEQPTQKLKYLLIFADAAFDIRNKEADPDLKRAISDLVPNYQSRESLDNVKSFSSEDYFGFLENNEGEWPETESNKDNHSLEIGVGRIPVKTIQEAEAIVEKLIFYDTNQKTIGNWRNKISLTADDGDANLHQKDSEDLAQIIQKTGKSFTADKIYVDAYPRLSGNALGKLSPGTSNKISNTFKKGALIFNYIGHGGAQNLSDEKILTREDIGNWQNLENLPLMVTATCQFGRYDNPGEISGAEKAILNPNGGAIALLTTTRPVYSSTNKKINEAFYNSVFEPINGASPRLGDVLRATKNNSFDSVFNRNFTLIGDPSMKLAYPEHKIVITKIKGKPITEKKDTLKALELVSFEGEIRNFRDKTLLENFNGPLFFTVFDKETTLETLGNNANTPMKYGVFQDKIFDGIVTVQNGKFKVNFTMPKDIRYNYGAGRVEMYTNNIEKNTDANGVFESFLVGGSKPNIEYNKNLPAITLYLSGTNLKKGNKTSKNPTIIANLKSDNGLNINSAAIGHEILAVLDGKTNYILNDYLIPKIDNNKEFDLKYQFLNLPLGKHKLALTIWDIYNNSTTSTLEFEVIGTESENSISISNYPNPINDATTITVDHSFIGENILANVTILSLNGKTIENLDFSFFEAENPLKINIPKNIKFVELPKGIYPYTVKLKSEKTNKTATATSKLIVID
jgi:hypothetical protein